MSNIKASEMLQCYTGASANSPAAREVFEYVPGAGDDEESWAQNLTPSLFWENRQVHLYTKYLPAVNSNSKREKQRDTHLAINIKFW